MATVTCEEAVSCAPRNLRIALPISLPTDGQTSESCAPSGCESRKACSANLRHDLIAVRADGAFFNAMVGMGENYFAAFALAMGIGQAISGLVTTVPLFLGAVLQLASPFGIRQLKSNRRWVVGCATLQALCFLPLGVAAWQGHIWPPLLFVIIAIYWGAGLATMPAWNTWVSRLVPTRLRATFFADRSRIGQAALLVGFLLAGGMLQVFSRWDAALIAFAGLFLLAMVCRLTSAAFLHSQTEIGAQRCHRLPLRELLHRLRFSGEGRLLAYLIAIQAAVQVSGPYFTPFMLKQLQLPYMSYALLIGTSFLAKIVAVSFWGRVARRFGARQLMWIGGIGVIPIAGLWLITQEFWYLMLVQVLSGICWAAYELAMFLLLFDTIREEERVSVLTAYNFANALATCLGSLAGGLLLTMLGQNYSAYLAVFGFSSLCRLGTVGLLVRVPSERPLLAGVKTSLRLTVWLRQILVPRLAQPDCAAARLRLSPSFEVESKAA